MNKNLSNYLINTIKIELDSWKQQNLTILSAMLRNYLEIHPMTLNYLILIKMEIKKSVTMN
jgi:hypothetical protein